MVAKENFPEANLFSFVLTLRYDVMVIGFMFAILWNRFIVPIEKRDEDVENDEVEGEEKEEEEEERRKFQWGKWQWCFIFSLMCIFMIWGVYGMYPALQGNNCANTAPYGRIAPVRIVFLLLKVKLKSSFKKLGFCIL